MYISVLKSKIHRAVVTDADLDYVGSITIDETLMKAANIIPYEKVQIVDINNGNRFETYVIPGKADTGVICLNGAAARCVQKSDLVIIMSYAQMTPEEAQKNAPKVVHVNNFNEIFDVTDYIEAGRYGEL